MGPLPKRKVSKSRRDRRRAHRRLDTQALWWSARAAASIISRIVSAPNVDRIVAKKIIEVESDYRAFRSGLTRIRAEGPCQQCAVFLRPDHIACLAP